MPPRLIVVGHINFALSVASLSVRHCNAPAKITKFNSLPFCEFLTEIKILGIRYTFSMSINIQQNITALAQTL
jgi:hypothetical protein